MAGWGFVSTCTEWTVWCRAPYGEDMSLLAGEGGIEVKHSLSSNKLVVESVGDGIVFVFLSFCIPIFPPGNT
jgi:hypothetical protein